ncbi:hypothetical protein [Nocardia paucivorans]|uniref:hypothetical protein n=1 Tax=Nocardia paucivorans TaxID=114259 RepID=UPI0002E36975|nr:hypothetical protein [Nocardia paucivorans]
MQTTQRTEVFCGRQSLPADLGIAERPEYARPTEDTGSGYGCRCSRCVAAQWDVQRLKYWLVGRLLDFGADEAVVDRGIDAMTVDVYWRKGEREYAIEVRSGPLAQQASAEHTARLRALGFSGVLWLCAPGFWVTRLPALGLADLAPISGDYRVVSGMLELGVAGVVVPRTEPYELREFLRGWVTGSIAWGYCDESRKGWASVTDWEQHTGTQARMLAQQHQELLNQRMALAVVRKTLRERTKQVSTLQARLESTRQFAQEQADKLALVNRKLADHYRVDNAYRATIQRLHRTIDNWQLITVCALLLLLVFITAAVVLQR